MEPGQLIGPYRLESLIAEGGMGAVWRAHHPTLDRLVAIKFVKSEARENQHARDAFMREVRNLSRLHGPQIVSVLDFGFTDEGDPYMVTEFLDGEDLLSRLGTQGLISVREAVFIGIEVLKALAEAHALGLIHRDLKPGNIFLQRLAGGARTAVKVLDFGVAKLVATDAPGEATLWPEGNPKGSPRYMAPEQVLCEPVTPAADIYAFGATLYRAVSGQPLFDGSIHGIMRGHLEGTPISLRTRCPGLDIPAEFDDIIMGCLAKKPDDRPHSADALQARLERLLQTLSEDETGAVEAGDYRVVERAESQSDGPAAATLSTGEALPGWLEPSLAPTGTGSLSGELNTQSADDVDGPASLSELSSPPVDEPAPSLGGWGESSALEPSSLELAFDPKETLSGVDEVHSRPPALMTEPISPPKSPSVAVRGVPSGSARSKGPGKKVQRASLRPAHWLALVAIVVVGAWFVSKDDSTPSPMAFVSDGAINSSRTYDFGRARWALDIGVEPDASTVDSALAAAKEFDAAAPQVRVRVVPGPALFREVVTSRVVCQLASVCDLPINKDIRVEQAGYRSKILSGDDLYDRRNNTWRIILQAR